jgi:hypothetical protein
VVAVMNRIIKTKILAYFSNDPEKEVELTYPMNSLLLQHYDEYIAEVEDLLDVKGIQKKRWKANKK